MVNEGSFWGFTTYFTGLVRCALHDCLLHDLGPGRGVVDVWKSDMVWRPPWLTTLTGSWWPWWGMITTDNQTYEPFPTVICLNISFLFIFWYWNELSHDRPLHVTCFAGWKTRVPKGRQILWQSNLSGVGYRWYPCRYACKTTQIYTHPHTSTSIHLHLPILSIHLPVYLYIFRILSSHMLFYPSYSLILPNLSIHQYHLQGIPRHSLRNKDITRYLRYNYHHYPVGPLPLLITISFL